MEQDDGGWFWVENKIIDEHAKALGPIGLAVYCLLARRSGNGKKCFPSRANIANTLGIAESTVKKSLDRIAALGLIGVEARRDPSGDAATNSYELKRQPLGVGRQMTHPHRQMTHGGPSDDPRVGRQTAPEEETLREDVLKKNPPTPHPADSVPEPGALSFALSEEQIRVVEDLNGRVSRGLTVNPTVLAFFRGWFQRGGTVAGLREVVEHGLQRNPRVSSLAYFQRPLEEWLAAKHGAPNSTATTTPRRPTPEEQAADRRRRMAAQDEQIRLDNPLMYELMMQQRAEARRKAELA